MQIKHLAHNTRYVHWLADPDKSGQAVHADSFATAFTLSFHDSECSRNGTFRAMDTAKCP